MSRVSKHIFRLHATGSQYFSTPHMNFKSYYVIYGARGDVQLHIIMTSNLMDEAISYTMYVHVHLYLVIATS